MGYGARQDDAAKAKAMAMRGKKRKSVKEEVGRFQKCKNLVGRCIGPLYRFIKRQLVPQALVPGHTKYNVRLMT